jgi:hypothetical protein
MSASGDSECDGAAGGESGGHGGAAQRRYAMKVSIKDLAVTMEIKNKGIELDVYDNDDNHLGDLVITKTRLVWCKGRTSVDNGKKISWNDFFHHLQGVASMTAPGSRRGGTDRGVIPGSDVGQGCDEQFSVEG